MKFSKFFLKNYSFFSAKKIKSIFFLKSKNGNQPFRQILNNTATNYFLPKSCVFDNIIIYKNFDLFNTPHYSYLSRTQLKSIH
jgi:hypothetical protein